MKRWMTIPQFGAAAYWVYTDDTANWLGTIRYVAKMYYTFIGSKHTGAFKTLAGAQQRVQRSA